MSSKTKITFELDLDHAVEELWPMLVFAVGAAKDSLTKDKLREILPASDVRAALMSHFIMSAYSAGVGAAVKFDREDELPDRPSALEVGYRANNVLCAIHAALVRHGVEMTSSGDLEEGRRNVEEFVARQEAVKAMSESMSKTMNEFFKKITDPQVED